MYVIKTSNYSAMAAEGTNHSDGENILKLACLMHPMSQDL